jgi:hypothetical protein
MKERYRLRMGWVCHSPTLPCFSAAYLSKEWNSDLSSLHRIERGTKKSPQQAVDIAPHSATVTGSESLNRTILCRIPSLPNAACATAPASKSITAARPRACIRWKRSICWRWIPARKKTRRRHSKLSFPPSTRPRKPAPCPKPAPAARNPVSLSGSTSLSKRRFNFSGRLLSRADAFLFFLSRDSKDHGESRIASFGHSYNEAFIYPPSG